MIKEFTSKPLGDYKGKPTKNILDKAMSKEDINKLRQFIEDTPQIKNVLSIIFDPSGKNGTYFKPRNLDKLFTGEEIKFSSIGVNSSIYNFTSFKLLYS